MGMAVLAVILTFVVLNMVTELAALSKMRPRTRLELLGNPKQKTMISWFLLIIMLFVHWGTLSGSMAAQGSFAVSNLTLKLATWWWGYIEEREVKPGVFHKCYVEGFRRIDPSTLHK